MIMIMIMIIMSWEPNLIEFGDHDISKFTNKYFTYTVCSISCNLLEFLLFRLLQNRHYQNGTL